MGQFAIVGFGFLVGWLIGLTGVGGGVLMTPLLILVFGVQPSIAIGTDLLYSSITKLFGAIKHWQQGTPDVRVAVTLALGSVPMALFGIGVAKVIKDAWGPAVQPLVSLALAWVCILVSLAMLGRVLLDRWGKGRFAAGLNLSPRAQTALTLVLGVVTGLLVGLTSVGAGSIVMIFLVLLYRLPAKRLVGTDVLHAAILSSFASLGHLWAGNIDFGLAASLLIGSIPGVLLGTRMSVEIPEHWMRVSLALILATSGTGLILHI